MRRCAVLLAAVPLVVACGRADGDVRAAEKFERFPLYWVGERFEQWDLEAVDGLDYPSTSITFIYGKCTPHDGDEPSCAPPFQIQVSRCGAAADAPAVYKRGVQVKVYRGDGSYPGLARKVLRALRPLNRVPAAAGCPG